MKRKQSSKEAAAKYAREWRSRNPGKAKAAEIRYTQRYPGRRKFQLQQSVARRRLKIFQAYGGAFCKCCGESEPSFLCLDHVDGGGSRHIKAIREAERISLHQWIVRNNFPKTPRLQVLCFNCNYAKGRSAKCPCRGANGL